MLIKNPSGRIIEIPSSMWPKLKAKGGYEEIAAMAAPLSMREKSLELSVIVLAWNKWEFTEKCLASIFEHTEVERDQWELIVVDNGSEDATPEKLAALKKDHPNLVVVTNATNRGVAGGRNDGILAARGRFLAFFDNDSTVGKGWDAIMLKTIKAAPDVGFVGRLGTVFHGFTQAGMRFVDVTTDAPVQVDVVSGGATMIRREVFSEVGLLDEWGMGEFWHEDSEICLRAALAGWLSFTVRFPWEHKYHSSYKAEKGDAWMEKFQANLDYIRRKVRKENVITIHRDYHGEKCPESLCIVATNLANELRKRGWVVVRRHTKRIVPISLRICTGFVLEHMGREYWWTHQENDIMPKAWSEPLEEADFILSPSSFCADNLARSGVPEKKLIRDLSPNGLDVSVYNTKVRPTAQFADTFLFFANGASQPRKGTKELVEAYFAEFTAADRCVLFIKDGVYGDRIETANFINSLRRERTDAPHVVHLYETWPNAKLAAFYRRAALNGVFVNPHRSEGFGLCILEALACGSRVITTGWGGNMDFCRDNPAVSLIEHDLVPSTFHNNPRERYYLDKEEPRWALPRAASLRKLMRAAYEAKEGPEDEQAVGIAERFDFRAVAFRFDRYFSEIKRKLYAE